MFLFFISAAATVHFDGSQHVRIENLRQEVSESEEINFRFRTEQKDAFILATRDESSTDRLEIVLGKDLFTHITHFNRHKLASTLNKEMFAIRKFFSLSE